MKRILSLFAALCLLILLISSVSATELLPKIVDRAGLLTPQQISILEDKAKTLSDTYEMDVVIVTVASLDGKTAEKYADDYFDNNGYGIGSRHSGVLLLLSMEYRDWAISTTGDGIQAITDYGVQSIFTQIAPDLGEDRYFEAFQLYLDTLDGYLEAYENGNPIDGDAGDYDGPGSYNPGTNELTASDIILRIVVALLIGAAAGGIVLLILRSQMNTARSQTGAQNYIDSGSFDLYRHQDFFLYSRTSKVRKPDPDSGGSSVHRGSSGRSHGGGHGKF